MGAAPGWSFRGGDGSNRTSLAAEPGRQLLGLLHRHSRSGAASGATLQRGTPGPRAPSVAAFAGYAGHYNTLISCCGQLGLIDEAQEFIVASNRIGPPLRLRDFHEGLRHFAHREVFVEGLRKAGVPSKDER